MGLATAMAWLRAFPGSRLTLLEKEPALARHQTTHNSGVIHSGMYYRPGSLKARTCVEGARLLVAFCEEHRIPYRLCGKLVVATTEAELAALEALAERARANGVPGVALVGPERMRELEPHARGVRALHVPGAGVVDYESVAQAFASVIRSLGGELRTSARVTQLTRREGTWIIESTAGEVRARGLITCGGLHADRLAAMAGAPDEVRIAPFRGEYYEVAPARRDLVRAMIYPVPDPALPFLGVHFTRGVDDHVHAGPNAVLALAREGYRKTDVSLQETLELMRFGGFWKMSRRFWRVGLEETIRSWSRRAFVRALQRLVPEVRGSDLAPGGSGVRAQALGADGSLLDDFDIARSEGAIHVRNVPSPAATASIRIGQLIADLAAQENTLQRAGFDHTSA